MTTWSRGGARGSASPSMNPDQGGLKPPRSRPNQIDKQIEAKLTRQRILTRDNPPCLALVLDEAALHDGRRAPGNGGAAGEDLGDVC